MATFPLDFVRGLSTVILLLACALGQLAFCQSTVGIQPLGSYANNGIDQIDLATLGVHVDIPLFDHAGRGKGMGISIHLVYDSSYVVHAGSATPDIGWRIVPATASPGAVRVILVSKEFVPRQCDPGVTSCNAGFYNYKFNFIFVDSTGYPHPFGDADSVKCVGVSHIEPCTDVDLSNWGGYATDDSGFLFVVNPTNPSPTPDVVIVTTPSGMVYNHLLSDEDAVTDRNGNSGTTNVSGTPYYEDWNTTLTDDTGISATITGGAYNSYDYTKWTSRAPLQVQYTDSSATARAVTVHYSLTACPNIGVVDSITYPDGSGYQFTYQPNAGCSLASMRLPTGGTITYNTTLDRYGSPASVSRSTLDGTTSYSRTANPPDSIYPTTSTTTISKADGSSEQINFVYDLVYATYDAGPTVGTNYSYETAHSWFSATGAVLKSTMKCYNGATGDCTTTSIQQPITQIATSTTLDTMTSQVSEFLNTAGLTTETDEYDFGASSPTRKTVTTYASLGNNIIDRPDTVTIYGVAGNTQTVFSNTTFGYDEYSLSATSNLPGHNSLTGSRGNLTSEHRSIAPGGATVDTHWKYDDAGQTVGAEDGRGNWTAYGYDPITDTCRTSTTPTTPDSGVSLATSATCYPFTGLLWTATDANGAITTYSYDAMLRPTVITTQASASLVTPIATTTRIYSGASLPTTLTTTVTASPSPDETTTTILDGLGRTSAVIDAGGARVDTQYDSMGRVYSVSNPYVGSSNGGTTFLYDALARRTSLCEPDHSGQCTATNADQSWNYSGNTVVFTDEVGNQWKRQTDALGRLTAVFEPNGTATAPSMETDYSYDPLDNLLSIVQWGGATGSSSARTRSFAYDGLSRLIAADNPETRSTSGTATLTCPGATGNWSTCYSYDPNGNLWTKTDERGSTTFTYDSMNRVRTKTGSGISYNYAYDVSAIGINGAFTPQYPAGRLVQESNNVDASVQYSYDPMGRIALQANTLPSECCSAASQTAEEVKAVYDQAGNVIDLTYPDGRHINQTWDGGGRITASSLVDIGGVANSQSYLQSVTYNADSSPHVTTLGNGVQQTIGQNSRLQVQAVTTSSPLFPFNGQSFASHSYCYTNCPNGAGANNGNIREITDALNPQRTEDYTYDTLNRLTSFALGGVTTQQYSIDPFGNMSLMSNGSAASAFDPLTNRTSNLPCAGSAAAYDAAGNQTCDTDQNGAVRQYTFDPENRIGQIAILGSNTPFVSYDYLPNGSRVRKSNADGTFTEYVYFDGTPIAEKDQNSNWIDRIYANGQQIAQTHSSDQALHLNGTVTCTTCGTIGAKWFLNAADGYTIQSGDKLAWRQYDGPNAIGSIDMWFTNCCGLGWQYADQNGEPVWTLAEHNIWVQRIFDLTPFAGQQLQTFSISAWPADSGDWDVWFQDMVLYRADGTVIPFYTRQNPLPTYLYGTFETTGTATTETVNVSQNDSTSLMATTYLSSDHLGTAQTQFASGGWPLWQGYFSPYGQEMNLQPYMTFPVNIATDNSQQFSGKERDQESGLDYFGARHYSSPMGRWISPDPTQLWYADPINPQSMNLYGYAWNNPHVYIDRGGKEVALAAVGAGIGFVTGFVGEWIHDDLSGKGFSWRDSLSYGAGGAATGALAGLTFGGSLLFQAAAGVTVSTAGTVGGGIISRELAGEDGFDSDSIITDGEVGLAGGVIGESVGGLWKVVNAKAIPGAPSPFGQTAASIRRLNKIAAWEANGARVEGQAVVASAVAGSLFTNVAAQAYSGWQAPQLSEYEVLFTPPDCAYTWSTQDGKLAGVSSCQ